MQDYSDFAGSLIDFVPHIYGAAIQCGRIKPGDCLPHEWDNKNNERESKVDVGASGPR